MISATRKAILKGLKKWFEDNPQHNTSTIKVKENNPLPVSARWLDNLKHAEKYQTNQAFDKELTIKLMKDLGVPYRLDGGVIFPTNKETIENETH